MSLTPRENALLHDRICGVLTRHLEPLFVKGMQLTFIARFPGNDESDVLVTSEADLNDITKVVQRSLSRPDVSPL
jgi:hypothetical protein